MSDSADGDQLDLPQAWTYLMERLTSSAALVDPTRSAVTGLT